MTELEDFDFVDDKLDKGERVKKRGNIKFFDTSMEFYDDVDDIGLSNLEDGVYVLDRWAENGPMTLREFLLWAYNEDVFKRVKIQGGEYAKREKRTKKT